VDWYRDSFSAVFHSSEDYSKASLTAFVVALRDSGVSPVSCNTYCRAVNAYLRWLREEGYTTYALRIPPMKIERKIIATFNRSQVDAFLKWKPRAFAEHRLHALVALLLDCGLRIQEALEFRREQIDLENLLVKVRGKGEKHRIVPISFEFSGTRASRQRRSTSRASAWRTFKPYTTSYRYLIRVGRAAFTRSLTITVFRKRNP